VGFQSLYLTTADMSASNETKEEVAMSLDGSTAETKVAASSDASGDALDRKDDGLGEIPFSLDEATGSEMVTLITKDNKRFQVSKKNALISKLLSATIEGDPTVTEIPTPQVSSTSMEHIIRYMNEHAGVEAKIIPKPLVSKKMADNCTDYPWDAAFVDGIGGTESSSPQNRELMYQLILDANFLDIKALLHLFCAKVGTWIKGAPLEKIKDILAVKTEAKSADSSQVSTSSSPASDSSNSSSPISATPAVLSTTTPDAATSVAVPEPVSQVTDALAEAKISDTSATLDAPVTQRMDESVDVLATNLESINVSGSSEAKSEAAPEATSEVVSEATSEVASEVVSEDTSATLEAAGTPMDTPRVVGEDNAQETAVDAVTFHPCDTEC
jgi:hypothetical protein